MKSYCLDTSGFSNPLEFMPEDIHRSLWRAISDIVISGRLAVNKEIYDELCHINGDIGDCLRNNKSALQLEVGDQAWDSLEYIGHTTRMQVEHAAVISEYNKGRKGTVGLNDISIIALAKTLRLPIISMENRTPKEATWKRIPNICDAEGVQHLRFNDFLRQEGIVL